ncbi:MULTISPECIES: hypothetical protein [unclassified Acidovorax]|uniref:hypothetical protein n=1 Tax=unclassified Acidovorax TaxID=2684926 RepID=UPI0028834F4E|nr:MULTISPECIES: hypothetical protein [unclassified Acidovorax]
MSKTTEDPLRKRPRRLWVAAVMNMVAGLIGLFMLAYLSTSPQVPDEFRPGPGAAVFSLATASLLIASSALALLGRARWDWLMLAAAVVYYGGILAQNIYILIQVQETAIPTQPLVSHAVRSGLEIAINLWAVLSAKTRSYFSHAN